MTICTKCGRDYVYDRNKGHRKTVCNSCKTNAHRLDRKQKMIDYKGGKCSVCGYDKCNAALDFHHIDPSTKSFKIGSNHTLAWETLLKELDKCILLCRNCHAELHYMK